jgi:hypothetical protein
VSDYPVGPGRHSTRGPVEAAYADCEALSRRCVTCGAEINSWCINKISGKPSKVPCGKRMTPQPGEAA